MGRIIAASVKGGMVNFDRRKITIESIESGIDLLSEFEIHLDGSMKETICELRLSWKYAPEKISVHSSEGVLIPVNRLGGEILIPSRVTGFDPRRVFIMAEWSEEQVKKIGEVFEFGLVVKYEEAYTDTVLVNSGRGLSADSVPNLATTSVEKSNLTYLPLEVVPYLARVRIRKFEDNSLHLDVDSRPVGPIISSGKYDYKGDFIGLSRDYDFSKIKRDSRGLPKIEIEGDQEKIAAYLEDFMRLSSIDDSNLTKREISERRRILISVAKWFEEKVTDSNEDIPVDAQLMTSTTMIRSGNAIGGRVGRKIIDSGIKMGSFVFDEESEYFGKIDQSIVVKERSRSNSYSVKCQVYSIITLIHIKSGGYKIKKVDFDEKLTMLSNGLRFFRTQNGFFENLDHLFGDKKPIEVNEEELYELLMGLDWIENIDY